MSLKHATRIVFQMPANADCRDEAPEVRLGVQRLVECLDPHCAVEFSRLALPHPDYPTAMDVRHLLTVWVPNRSLKRGALSKVTALVRDCFPGYSLSSMLEFEIAKLELRAREVVASTDEDGSASRPVPGLKAAVWHGFAPPSFLEALASSASPPRQHSRFRRSGLLSQAFGVPADTSQPTHPLFRAEKLRGRFHDPESNPVAFARSLPMDESTARVSAAGETESPLLLTDRAGRLAALDVFGRPTMSGHWLIATDARSGRALLDALTALAVAKNTRVWSVRSKPGPIDANALLKPLQEDVHSFYLDWLGRFVARQLAFDDREFSKFRMALYCAVDAAGSAVTWKHVAEEAQRLDFHRSGLSEMSVKGRLQVDSAGSILFALAQLNREVASGRTEGALAADDASQEEVPLSDPERSLAAAAALATPLTAPATKPSSNRYTLPAAALISFPAMGLAKRKADAAFLDLFVELLREANRSGLVCLIPVEPAAVAPRDVLRELAAEVGYEVYSPAMVANRFFMQDFQMDALTTAGADAQYLIKHPDGFETYTLLKAEKA